MGQRQISAGAAKQVQMAMLSCASMAVVVALTAADRINQIALGIVTVELNGLVAREGPNQGAVPLDKA